MTQRHRSQAAQLKIEDQAWSLRSIFFRPDFGPEWREIRDAATQADGRARRFAGLPRCGARAVTLDPDDDHR